MFWMLLATASAADLWLDLEATDDEGEVHLHLPANDLLDPDNHSEVTVNGTKVDLAAEARAMHEAGDKLRRFTVDDGVLTLARVDPPKKGTVDTLVVGLKGPLGMGLDLTLPLDGSGDLDKVNQPLGDSVKVEGVDLSFSDADTAQLRRAGPLELVRIVGPAGGGLTVSTR